MKYALQLNPDAPHAWQFMVRWPGYWAGLGYVDDPRRAILFRSKKEANRIMVSIFVGLNGCMKVVAVSPADRGAP